MDTVLQDIRYGVRFLVKHRAFSAVAILTLAVGIGVATALFSVIDAALLRPLPYPHPEELVDVTIRETSNGKPGRYGPSMDDLRAWRESGRVFSHIGAGRVTGFVPRVVEAGQAERVVLLNEEGARRLFPDGSAVGRFLETREPPRRIIGVVGNIRHSGPLWAPRPEVYQLYGQIAPHPLRIVLRPRPSAVLSADRLRQMAEAVGPKVLVGPVRSGTDDLSERVVTPRRRTVLLGLLGALGMLLTLVGIFSMTAYAVARRTQEIGIRMALGARPADVTRAMVRDAAWPALIGLSAGLAGAFYATRVIASFLFETTPHDPATFATVAALMGGATLVAAWLPARRAARVDPVTALRAE